MKGELIPVVTSDGSTTILNTKLGEHYHSVHGAETESLHVFIRNGLDFCLGSKRKLRILEVGLGTGLNLCLSISKCAGITGVEINYTGLEAYPLPLSITESLNFNVLNESGMREMYAEIHAHPWNSVFQLKGGFVLEKVKCDFRDFQSVASFDLIYYDAFGPKYQPEMWNERSVEVISGLMHKNAVFVTYCAQGRFRRLLESAGFGVERLTGPPGKREMIRAVRR